MPCAAIYIGVGLDPGDYMSLFVPPGTNGDNIHISLDI